MLRLLLRSLLFDRTRTLLSLLAVGSAILLVVVLEGFQAGLWQQVRAYREHLPVQLVAAPAGASDAMQVRSGLDPAVAAQVGAVSGVQQVYPQVSVPAIFDHGGVKTPVSIVGYGGPGGPWRLRAGSEPGPGELVMDYALARKHGLRLGGTAPIFGRDFTITGFSDGTSSMLGSYIFLPLDDAFSVLSPGGGGAPNLLLVQTAPGSDIAAVRRAIEVAVPAVDLLTPAELAANDVAVVQELMGSTIDLMVAVAYIVGILVIGLTLYAAVFERLREVGIMKAVGVGNRRLSGFVLGQAAVFIVVGFALGLAGALGIAALVDWVAPQYAVEPLVAGVLLRSGVAALVMAALASLLPIKQVAGVDPALVFRQ